MCSLAQAFRAGGGSVVVVSLLIESDMGLATQESFPALEEQVWRSLGSWQVQEIEGKPGTMELVRT